MEVSPTNVYKCDICGFQLTKNVLYSQTGAVAAVAADSFEICPNDIARMRKMTWEELFRDSVKVCEGQIARAVAAEEKVSQLEGTIFNLKATISAYEAMKAGIEAIMFPENDLSLKDLLLKVKKDMDDAIRERDACHACWDNFTQTISAVIPEFKNAPLFEQGEKIVELINKLREKINENNSN